MMNKPINKVKFKKLLKECVDYKTTKQILIDCVNEKHIITFDMFQEFMDKMTYYRIKEEIK